MRLQAGVSAPVIVQDNGVGDLAPTTGLIYFSGAVGSYVVNVEIGQSKPVVGTPTQAVMDLTVTANQGGSDVLNVSLTDTNFPGGINGTGVLTSLVNGRGPVTATFQTFVDPSNTLFGTSGASVCTTGTQTINGGAATQNCQLAGNYSMTLVARAPLTAGQVLSVDHLATVDVTSCGAIGDYVWYDADRDGIQDGGEPGLNGVRMLLESNGIVVATTTTGPHPIGGAAGYYQFPNACAGNYLVRVDPTSLPSGYVATEANAGGDDTVDSDSVAGGPVAVTLAVNGASNQTIDFGFVSPCTGSIGNFVWNDLNQNGVQDAGEPGINGVLVRLTPGNQTTVTSANGGQNGYYQFSGLCAGTYSVEVVTPPPGMTLTTGGVGDPALDSNFNPAPVVLVGDNASDQTIDFGYFTTCTGEIGNFVWTDFNRNGIQDQNEPGIQGVRVSLRKSGALIETVFTDVNGLYLFRGLCGGDYTVTVDQTSVPVTLVPSPSGQGADRTKDSNGSPAAVTLPLNGVDLTIDFGYMPPCTGSIGNFVWNDLNRNGRQDAGEAGIGVVQMELRRTSDNSLIAVTTTDASGFYQFVGLCPGDYKVVVIPPGGYAPTTSNASGTTPENDSNGSPAMVTLTNSAPSDFTIDFGYVQPAGLGDFVWNDLNANGVQDGGEPGIAGVLVTLLDCLGNPGKDVNGNVVPAQNTDANGNYLFTNLASGCYRVRFATPAGGFTPSPANVGADAADSDSLGGTTGDYTLAAGETNLTVDAGFYRTASLGDFVWEDLNRNGIQETGEPGIPGVLVALLRSDNTSTGMTALTSATGGYLFSNLAPACYKVQFATPAGFTPSPFSQGGNDGLDSDAGEDGPGRTGLYCLSAGENNLTVDAGFNKPASPGLRIVKTANPKIINPYQPVTYSYLVTNTGGTTLFNIAVTDDNGTPSLLSDDFFPGCQTGNPIPSLAPGASVTCTATVIPVVSTQSVVNGSTVNAGAVVVVVPQANGDIKVTYLQDFGINDNTYGTGAIGWPNGHTFGNLTGSDKLEFSFFDKNGVNVLAFYVDTISAASSVTVPGTGQVISFPSGYGTLGPFGGDGSMVTGSANNIVSFSTSISDNLNNALNVPKKATLTVDSPTSLVNGNVVVDMTKAPGGWNHINSYTVVVKASTFGAAGFGSVAIPDQHNSPNKLAGPNGMTTTPKDSTVVNTACATVVGTNLATCATAAVAIVAQGTAQLASLSGYVYFDANNNGVKDAGEAGIPSVSVGLSGTESATAFTDVNGFYSFTNLVPGTYTITETQPAAYIDGKDAIGSQGGNTGNDVLSNIVLLAGVNGVNNNFGEINSTVPNFSLVKEADALEISPFDPVNYSYTVTNTGQVTLYHLVVKDDYGTPDFAGDDVTIGTIPSLAPGAMVTLTATLYPVVSTTTTVNGATVPAGQIVVVKLPNGDFQVTYVQGFNINDNTYGTGAIGWPNGHKFGDLTGSDKLEFRFFNGDGTKVLDFYQDYITSSGAFASGYGSLCASGGDGSLVFGSVANIVSCTTSLAENLNNTLNLPKKAALIVDSPTSLAGGQVVVDMTKAPGGWDYVNSYTAVIKGSTFGASGFGRVEVPDQHNSPNKYAAPNSMITTLVDSAVINVATGKAALVNDANAPKTLVTTATSEVDIVVPPVDGGGGLSVVSKKLDKNNVDVVILNGTAADVFLTGVTLTWPAANGMLKQVKLDGDIVYDSPDIAGTSTTLTLAQLAADPNKRKIQKGTSDVFRLVFEKSVVKDATQYSGILTFSDGTTLTILP